MSRPTSTPEPTYVAELRERVTRASELLSTLPDGVLSWRADAAAWSIREIIGHLIDSAANNHQRFVRARSQPDLVFGGYAQDDWVRAQDYQSADSAGLLDLWRAYNLHLAHVMAATPDDVRLRVHARHNLHEIGWRPFPADRPATLDDLMRDYVDHLKHHLAQVDALIARASSSAIAS